jgi:hypothetical protein
MEVVALSWIKLPDTIIDDPDLLDLSSHAFRIYICMTSWSGKHLTDGVVPVGMIRHVCAMIPRTSRPRAVQELIDSGLFIDHGDTLEIRGYLEHQRSKAEVDKDRETNRQKQAEWRARRDNRVTNSGSNPSRSSDLRERERRTDTGPALNAMKQNAITALVDADNIAKTMPRGS